MHCVHKNLQISGNKLKKHSDFTWKFISKYATILFLIRLSVNMNHIPDIRIDNVSHPHAIIKKSIKKVLQTKSKHKTKHPNPIINTNEFQIMASCKFN